MKKIILISLFLCSAIFSYGQRAIANNCGVAPCVRQDTVTHTGTVDGGFSFASFYNSSTTIAATVNGKPLEAGVVVNFPIKQSQPYSNKSFNSNGTPLSFDGKGAKLYIMIVY